MNTTLPFKTGDPVSWWDTEKKKIRNGKLKKLPDPKKPTSIEWVYVTNDKGVEEQLFPFEIKTRAEIEERYGKRIAGGGKRILTSTSNPKEEHLIGTEVKNTQRNYESIKTSKEEKSEKKSKKEKSSGGDISAKEKRRLHYLKVRDEVLAKKKAKREAEKLQLEQDLKKVKKARK